MKAKLLEILNRKFKVRVSKNIRQSLFLKILAKNE